MPARSFGAFLIPHCAPLPFSEIPQWTGWGPRSSRESGLAKPDLPCGSGHPHPAALPDPEGPAAQKLHLQLGLPAPPGRVV